MKRFATSRRLYQLEQLERRYFLTIVPIDATVGVPFEGLVATGLRLPAHATGLELVNVMINGQWDYAPTAVVRDDGTFDLYARMTPQRSGTADTTIWFRNDRTGGWDLLESGQQTIKASHFSARIADVHVYNRVPGTQMRDVLTTFETTELTQSLDDYVVEVDWFGQAKTGRLVSEDGAVNVYVDDAYLPLARDGDVFVTIRLADAAPGAPAAGYTRAYVSSGAFGGIGIGMFYGSMTSENEFRIDLPKAPPLQGTQYHYFVPAAESDGWDSTFIVDLIWHTGRNVQTSVPATVVRNADGSYAIVGEMPADREIQSPQLKIHETIHRPAVDGQPAQTYTVDYVGSFEIAEGKPSEPAPVVDPPAEGEGKIDEPANPESPEFPVDFGGGVVPLGGDSRFSALTGLEMSALDSRGFDAGGTSLFSSLNDDDDAFAGDDDLAEDAPALA